MAVFEIIEIVDFIISLVNADSIMTLACVTKTLHQLIYNSVIYQELKILQENSSPCICYIIDYSKCYRFGTLEVLKRLKMHKQPYIAASSLQTALIYKHLHIVDWLQSLNIKFVYNGTYDFFINSTLFLGIHQSTLNDHLRQNIQYLHFDYLATNSIIRNNNLKSIELIFKQCKFNQTDIYKFANLAVEYGHVEILQLIEQYGYNHNLDQLHQLLVQAAVNDHVSVFEYLLEVPLDEYDFSRHLLKQMVKNECMKMLEWIKCCSEYKLLQISPYLNSLAIRCRNCKILEFLLQAKIPCDQYSEHDLTSSLILNDMQIFKWLHYHGIPIKLNARDMLRISQQII